MFQSASNTSPRTPVKSCKARKRGIGLVPLGFYLIGAASILAVALTTYQTSQTKRKYQQDFIVVNQTLEAAREMYRGQDNYGVGGAPMVPALEANNLLPELAKTRRVNRNHAAGLYNLRTAFGGVLSIRSSLDGEDLVVTMNNYTKAQCMAFMSNYIGKTARSGGIRFATVVVDGADDDNWSWFFRNPPTMNSLQSDCRDGDLKIRYR